MCQKQSWPPRALVLALSMSFPIKHGGSQLTFIPGAAQLGGGPDDQVYAFCAGKHRNRSGYDRIDPVGAGRDWPSPRSVVNVGFIIGAGGGQGALNLRGRDYPFSVSGIGLGAFGASAAEFVGRAYNLRSPYDLVGSYSAVGAGAAVVGGVRVTRLRNANGVVLELRGGQVGLGLELNVGVSGVTITMP